jgi:hypothetical protein
MILAWGLHSLGIRRGDRVANVAETNRPEWNFIEWGKKRRPIPVSAIRLVQAKTCLLCAARSFPRPFLFPFKMVSQEVEPSS